jgi:hypothetical protein
MMADNNKKDKRFSELLSSIENGKVVADKQFLAQLRDKSVIEFETFSAESEDHIQIETISIWRIIMKSPISKLAVAAVVIFAVMIGVNQFGGSIDGVGVAWGKVAEKIEQMPTCKQREKRIVTCDGKELPFMTSDVVKYLSPNYGYREDMYNQSGQIMHHVYALSQERVSITVIPVLKQYKIKELTEAEVRIFEMGFEQIIEQLKSGQYTELGRKTIDGIEVEGIEFSNPTLLVESGYPIKFDNVLIRLWADIQTSLPVRIDAEATTSDKYITTWTGGKPVEIESVADQFQWYANVDRSVFEPNIPDDYTFISDEADSHDEGKAVLGLQKFAELTGGQYPSNLEMMTVLQESCPVIQKYIDKNPDNEEKIEKMRKVILAAKSSCLFYTELVKQNKDVVYYGDTVTAEDTDAALMRWKISDDEYRVIFGDLTAENIPAEQLAELEGSSSE